MRSRLTSPQTAALRWIAGFDPPGKKPLPVTLLALAKKGLIVDAHAIPANATSLGRIAATMNGWVPNARQSELIIALATHPGVESSNEYWLPRFAPAGTLNSFGKLGLAVRPDIYSPTHEATELCRQLAAMLAAEVSL